MSERDFAIGPFWWGSALKNRRPVLFWLWLMRGWLASVAFAGTESPIAPVDWPDILAAHYAAQQLVALPVLGLDREQADLIGDQFVERLETRLGPRIGYKASLISAAARENFGVATPLRGVLLRDMIYPSGAVLDAELGVAPLMEGDLLVRVADRRINRASTPEEVLAYIDAVIPFIEIPDIFWPRRELDSIRFIMGNCGARAGVVGDPIPIDGDRRWLDKLRNFSVRIHDGAGRELATGSGDSLMGQPLRVVVWLVQELRNRGEALRPGDLLSLGSLTKPVPVQGAQRITASYQGLAEQGTSEVTVQFR